MQVSAKNKHIIFKKPRLPKPWTDRCNLNSISNSLTLDQQNKLKQELTNIYHISDKHAEIVQAMEDNLFTNLNNKFVTEFFEGLVYTKQLIVDADKAKKNIELIPIDPSRYEKIKKCLDPTSIVESLKWQDQGIYIQKTTSKFSCALNPKICPTHGKIDFHLVDLHRSTMKNSCFDFGIVSKMHSKSKYHEFFLIDVILKIYCKVIGPETYQLAIADSEHYYKLGSSYYQSKKFEDLRLMRRIL